MGFSEGRKIYRIHDWRADIVGFVTDEEFCFLFFKVDGEVPCGSRDLGYDFNWLENGLKENAPVD